MTFMAHFFVQLVTTDKYLPNCISESYKVAFGPNHSYVIQTAAWAAMKIVGSREWMMGKLGITNLKE